MRRSSVLCLSLIFLLTPFAGAVGQEVEPPPYRPPVMTFPDGRISLMEAVRLTIEHDPQLKLQEQSALFQAGVAQMETGRFDTSLLASTTMQFTQEELRGSQQRAEQQRRDDIRELIDEFKVRADAAEAQLNELRQLQQDPTGFRTSNTGIQAQIDVLNAIIAGTADPETRAEFIRVRDNLIADYVAEFEKATNDLRADENEQREKLRKLGDIPTVNQNYLGIVNVSLLYPLRNGMFVEPFFETSFEGTRFRGKPKEAEFGGKGIEDLWRFLVGVGLDIPLMRGSGVESAAAFERAAHIDYAASLNSLRHAAAARVLNTVIAYWNLVAAQQRVEIARQSLGLQEQRVATSRALIEGDELPRAELSRVLASEASDRALLTSAERNLVQARVALAEAVGLAVDGEENAPLAADDFPTAAELEALAALDPEGLVAAALQRRYDYLATQQLEQSGKVLLRAARLDLRPLFDISPRISWTAVGETTIAEAVDRWVGPSVDLVGNFSKPFGNNTFKGIVKQREALLNQRMIQSTDLQRLIRNNTVLTLRSLDETVRQLESAAEAVEFYRETIAAEEEKFRLGSSTLIDTILTQQLQTSALLALVNAQQQYANLLARLRFETGTLVVQEGDETVVSREQLITIPPTITTPDATR